MYFSWFKRKKYGLRWTPVSWQGWLIALIFTIAIFRNFLRIDEDSHSVSDTLINFIPQTIGLVLILALVCWLTSPKQQPPSDIK